MLINKGFKTVAHIHSLEGEMREVVILFNEKLFGHPINNSYICFYNGILCTGIFNPCTQQYYVDDVDGIVNEHSENYVEIKGV